jgi:hypothetical protein
MAWGFSKKQLKRPGFLDGIFITLIITGLYGCAPPAQPVVEKARPCTISDPQSNIYKLPLETWGNGIFQYAATPNAQAPAMQEQLTSIARYQAFQYLIKATRRWSDAETFVLDGSSEAQVTVTFLSPELIQAIYLSGLLKDSLFSVNFETRTRSILDKLAKRNELLFLVIVSSTKYDNSTLNPAPPVMDLPISEMVLINAEDLKVPPNHDDHTLEQPIYVSCGPVYGYLAYPLAVEENAECKWLLDPTYNTSIVISAPSVLVNGADRGPHTWTIQYESLLDPGLPVWLPSFNSAPPGFDQNLLTPLTAPPIPPVNLTTTMDENSIDLFWRDMARFIWGYVMLENW